MRQTVSDVVGDGDASAAGQLQVHNLAQILASLLVFRIDLQDTFEIDLSEVCTPE